MEDEYSFEISWIKPQNAHSDKRKPPNKKKKLSARQLLLERKNLPLEEILSILQHNQRRWKVQTPDKPVFQKCLSILVDWMAQAGDGFNLSNVTISSAVALVTKFLDSVDVPRSRLQLVACAAILVAAKLEEQEELIPMVVDLNFATDNSFTPEAIIQMEAFMLHNLRWDITAVTPLHFLGIYLEYCISSSDLLNGQKILNNFGLSKDIAKSAEFFLDVCRQDCGFLKYDASLLAASAIALTRKILKIEPAWSADLVSVTQYQSSALRGCMDHMWEIYKTNFLCNPHNNS